MNLLQGLGQAKPVSEFINTAMQYQTTQSALETQRLQQQKLAAENAQLEKDNKEYDPNAVLSLFDEHKRPHIFDAWKGAGVIDPATGMIRGKDIRNTQTHILNNQKVTEALLTAEYEQLSKKAATLSKKTDPKSQAEALDVVSQMTAIEKAKRLGKDKTTTLVPKGTKGTIDSEGKFTPFEGGAENINNVDLGTWQGTAESGADVYHTPLGNVAVDPETQERRPYSIQSDGSIAKKDETLAPAIKEFESVYPDLAGKAGTPEYTKAYKEWKVMAATERAKVFSAIPTNVPGIFFDRISQQYYQTDEGGNHIRLSSNQVKDMKLQFIEDTPTQDIKVMKQSVPSVQALIKESRASLDRASKDMGPIKGRFSEFMAGKVGTDNKDWISLRTNIKLLETRLMKMHVGARGGEYILKHFEGIFGYGFQSPENLKEALRNVEAYAEEIEGTPSFPSSQAGKQTKDTIIEYVRDPKTGKLVPKGQ